MAILLVKGNSSSEVMEVVRAAVVAEVIDYIRIEFSLYCIRIPQNQHKHNSYFIKP